MSSSETDLAGGPSPSQLDGTRFLDAWVAALARTSHVSMSSVQVERFLHRLACSLAEALQSQPFRWDLAYHAGRALVRANLVGEQVLGRTVRVIATYLLGEATPGWSSGWTDTQVESRLLEVQEAVITGYVQALRRRTLVEQETIRLADLEARARAEKALRASEARFRAVFAEAGIGIGLADVDGRIVEANQAFATMLGYAVDDFCTLRVTDLMHPDDGPTTMDVYQAFLHGAEDCVRMERRYRHRNGSAVWTNMTASLIRGPDGSPRYTLAMVEDISERRLLQERLHHQAHHDPLTQLPNRALFFERLAAALAEPDAAARIGVCYLDLDGFKVINDTQGHHVGDELLVAVAHRLNHTMSRPGVLVARMGGDEFVILVERSTGVDEVAELARAVLVALDTPFDIGGNPLMVSASVGVVERPIANATASEVMKAADTTLYWAKSDGRGRLAVFDPERSAREKTRHTLAATMSAGLEGGQFVIDYQPLVALADGRIRGLEALVRWQHPQLGRLMPDEFIGLAEETGFIVPLGRWVLRRACEQARQWQQLFPESPVYVSVNLAARQAWDPGVVGDVSRILDETGISAELLQLELTESDVMGTAGRPLEALEALSDIGVRLAIDDFGTGYSNLAYLRRLPVQELKLAGSFVEGLRTPDDAVDEPIVAALVDLAHTLGLTVTAEGVEERIQAERLRALSCDTAQGWYFARPGDTEKMTELLRSGPIPASADQVSTS